MSVQVNFPAIMQPLVENQKTVTAEGATVAELIEHIDARHPGIKERLVADGELLGYINLFLNDDDVRFMGRLNTSVKRGDTLTVLPAVAGG